MIARNPRAFREKQNIDARIRHEVLGIDLDGRRVQVADLEAGKTFWEPFDHLMIATGAVPVRPPIDGIDAEGIHGVGTLQSGIDFKQVVDEKKPQRAVVVGGGYIGLEMAEALLMRGVEVSMVEMAPQVMGTLDPDMGALVSRALEAAGAHLHLGEALEGFEVEDGRMTAVVTENRTLPADLVVLGMGVRPNSDLAKAAEIPLGEKGGIIVNERQHTRIEGVWSAGDCVQSFHLVSRRPFFVALGTVANKQGRVAGINIGGGYATFPGAVGTAITKIYETEVARTGLQERELEGLELEWAAGKVEARTHAGYYPGAAPMTVKVLAEKGSGRLLGGQIVGGPGSGKRIDILATALHAGFTLDEMLHLDLAYAPPFSAPWDPVVIAVRKAMKGL